MECFHSVLVLLILAVWAPSLAQPNRPRGARVDLSRVRAGDAATTFGLVQDEKKQEEEKEEFRQSELDKTMGSTSLHLMVEAPKWAQLNAACAPGSTAQFYAEGRLKMRTDDWSGTGRIRSGFACTNQTRCGSNELTVVQTTSGLYKVQQDILALSCSGDPRGTLFQIECGGGTSGCIVYGPTWLRAESQEAETEEDRRTDPGFNPFPHSPQDSPRTADNDVPSSGYV